MNIMLLFLVNKIRRFRKKTAALPCIFPATTANKLNHSEATNGYTYISVLLKTGADQKQAETDIQSFFADKYAKRKMAGHNIQYVFGYGHY